MNDINIPKGVFFKIPLIYKFPRQIKF